MHSAIPSALFWYSVSYPHGIKSSIIEECLVAFVNKFSTSFGSSAYYLWGMQPYQIQHICLVGHLSNVSKERKLVQHEKVQLQSHNKYHGQITAPGFWYIALLTVNLCKRASVLQLERKQQGYQG